MWTWLQRCNHWYELDYKDEIIDMKLTTKMYSLIWTWLQRWKEEELFAAVFSCPVQSSIF